MKTLLIKEFRENWRSFRYPALLLVLLFFALADPPMLKYMNDFLAYFAEIEIAMPDPSPQDALATFLGDASQIGILVLIFISMGSIAREKENGVAGWILSKPVSRWEYFTAKAVSLYAIIIAAIASSSAIAYLYTWSLLGRVDLVDALWATISFTVFALLYGTITFALSAVVKSPMQAGGLTILIFFLSGILNLLVSETGIRDFYPNTLLSEMALLACGQSTPGDAAIPLAVTLGLSAAILLLAGLRFQKIEL
ncbi:MAG: ABC transporter permease subunit [Dethiobacteria bacterium]